MYQHIAINGRQIHYRMAGKGPAILLLHGFLGSLEIWNDFISRAQENFSLVAVDLPGHGRSENQAEVHTMELMAELVHALLATLGISSVMIVGHSMGGYVGLSLAKTYPDLVSGLVLLHSHAAADTEEARQHRERAIIAVKANHTGFIHAFIPSLFAEGNRGRLSDKIQALSNLAAGTSKKAIIAALVGMKQRADHLTSLSVSPLPLLFVAGKKDERIPFEIVAEQARHAFSADLLALENVGHMGFLEAPEEVFSAILGFYQRLLMA